MGASYEDAYTCMHYSPVRDQVIAQNAQTTMIGNRNYAWGYISLLGMLLASVLFINPAPAAAFWPGFPFTNAINAAPATEVNVLLTHRLCERQKALGNRLIVPLIVPGACETTPPPPPAPTLAFSADPVAIEEGASSTLSWDSTHTTSCTASGGWSGSKAVDGSESVAPSATTTYALTCTGAGGSVARSVTITVTDAPAPPPTPTLSFTANPTTVNEGASSQLIWSAEYADSCLASNGWSGAKSISGNQIVTPTASTTYELDCTGPGGSVHAEVFVAFVPLAPEPEPQIVINEIAWMGSMIDDAAVANAEWIELRNLGNSTVDLASWTLVGTGNSPAITITDACANASIPAHGFYLLVRANDPTISVTADCVYPGGGGTANLLSNSGELLELRNASVELVDSVDGSNGWRIDGAEHPIGNNDTKETAQRADDGVWFTGAPTPGA